MGLLNAADITIHPIPATLCHHKLKFEAHLVNMRSCSTRCIDGSWLFAGTSDGAYYSAAQYDSSWSRSINSARCAVSGVDSCCS